MPKDKNSGAYGYTAPQYAKFKKYAWLMLFVLD